MCPLPEPTLSMPQIYVSAKSPRPWTATYVVYCFEMGARPTTQCLCLIATSASSERRQSFAYVKVEAIEDTRCLILDRRKPLMISETGCTGTYVLLLVYAAL